MSTAQPNQIEIAIQEVLNGASDPNISSNVKGALARVVQALQSVNTAVGNQNGNLNPVVNTVSDNPITATSVGTANTNAASPVSDDVVNTVGLQGCSSNISPVVESPITITTLNNCVFSSIVSNVGSVDTNSLQQNIVARASVGVQLEAKAKMASWIKFLKQMRDAGFTDSLAVMELLYLHNGDFIAVMEALTAQQ
jgi:hypothetical protein